MRAGFGRSTGSGLPRSGETVLLAMLLSAPLIVSSGSGYRMYLSSLMVLYVGAASGLTILIGVARQLHLGQSALMAVGAYTAAIVTERWGGSIPIEIAIAVAIGGAVGLIIGAVTLRLSGLYLALATLGLVLGMSSLIANWTSLTNGAIGFPTVAGAKLFGSLLSPNNTYILEAVLLLVQGAAIFGLKRSTYWGAIKLIGDRDYLASCVGIRVYAYRIVLMVVVSMVGALWGVMYSHVVGYIDPTTFGLSLTIPLLMMVVLGGLGSFWGSIVGAYILVEIPQWLASLQSHQQLIYGVILLAVILIVPKGLFPTVQTAIGRSLRQREARRRPTGAGTVGAPAVGPTGLLLSGSGRFDSAGLEVRDVAVSFGGIRALAGATLTVEPGQIEGLIGTNGSGKTTMLNCVSGLVQPQQGSIVLDGQELIGLRPDQIARAGLARTFQSPQTVLEMTALENAVLGWHQRRTTGVIGVALGLPKARREERRQLEEARAMCVELGLGELIDHPAEELSTGDRRFVELVRALGSRPRLLFLDEPATGLTGSERDRLIALLRRLRDEGLTMVVIDHDMEFLFQMADHVTVLDRGENIAIGSPEEVRNAPAVINAYFGQPAARA